MIRAYTCVAGLIPTQGAQERKLINVSLSHQYFSSTLSFSLFPSLSPSHSYSPPSSVSLHYSIKSMKIIFSVEGKKYLKCYWWTYLQHFTRFILKNFINHLKKTTFYAYFWVHGTFSKTNLVLGNKSSPDKLKNMKLYLLYYLTPIVRNLISTTRK